MNHEHRAHREYQARHEHQARDERKEHHEHQAHTRAQAHHHHTHARASLHPGGHHLLQVEDLSVAFRMYDSSEAYFRSEQRDVSVIDKLSISVHEGEVVAVVGASGSGKSILADAIMGIYEPNATVTGRIWFDGVPMDADALSHLRGHGLSLVPQSVASLDPLMKVGKQVQGVPEGRGAARRADETRRRARQRELFERYGLAPEVGDLYPHELSGGMARRVLLCCALMDEPRVIVADEPTPGLDLDLAVRAMDDLRSFADAGGGVMLITHDIELALRVANRVAVFKDGTVVEETSVENFASPDLLAHPFSRQLWHALPEHEFCVVCEGEGGVREDISVTGCSDGRFREEDAAESLWAVTSGARRPEGEEPEGEGGALTSSVSAAPIFEGSEGEEGVRL